MWTTISNLSGAQWAAIGVGLIGATLMALAILHYYRKCPKCGKRNTYLYNQGQTHLDDLWYCKTCKISFKRNEVYLKRSK